MRRTERPSLVSGRRRRDQSRLRDVFGEAGRNLTTGAAHGLLALVAFLGTAVPLAGVASRGQVDLARSAAEYLSAGASIRVVELAESIDGATCDALATASGVRAAGALRVGPSVRLAALPSREFQTYEATAGLAAVLGIQPAQGGLWLSGDVAATLAATTGAELALLPSGMATVAGVFAYPNDGRSPLLSYAVLAPGAGSGGYDSCWIDVGLHPQFSSALMLLPVLAEGSLSRERSATPVTTQLNTTLGARFDATAGGAVLTASQLAAVSGLAGVLLGLGLIRARRLQLAATLHAGMAKPTLCVQLLIEAAGWLMPALRAGGALIGYVSLVDNPGDWWPAYYPGVRCLAMASLGVIAGTLVAALTTFERHLFRYFKAR